MLEADAGRELDDAAFEELVTQRVGNASNDLCPSCGKTTKLDPTKDKLVCAACDGTGVFDTWNCQGNPYRNANAFYFLPSEDEWYKAAYYSGSGSTYFDYATQQDAPNTPTAVTGGASGAVYGQSLATGPADIDNAGGASHYGTIGQNGNVFEWSESAFDGSNNANTEDRAIRGGSWYNAESNLRTSVRLSYAPTNEHNSIGFRVASVPEPSAAMLMLMPGGAWLLRRRSRRSL